jgi:hypothetical protein
MFTKIPNTNIIFYVGSKWQGGKPNKVYVISNRQKNRHEELAKHEGEFLIEKYKRKPDPRFEHSGFSYFP